MKQSAIDEIEAIIKREMNVEIRGGSFTVESQPRDPWFPNDPKSRLVLMFDLVIYGKSNITPIIEGGEA